MQFGIFLFSAISIAISGGTYAQDKIYRRDDVIFDSSYGNAAIKKGKSGGKYSKNTISIIPVECTTSADHTMNDVGIGICYELFPGNHDRLSFNVPVSISFSSMSDFTNDAINYNYNGHPIFRHYHSYTVDPGIKFYPSTYISRIRYSVGVSFFATLGSEPYVVYDDTYYFGNNPLRKYSYALCGFILSNSINIVAGKRMLMAMDFGVGAPVVDNRFIHQGIDSPFMQIGLKAGYRFKFIKQQVSFI